MFKVMVVDDEMIVRKGIITSIDWSEHHIVIAAEAKNGEEALHKLAGHRVDLVLTDIRMPVMSGIELARQVKGRYPEIEVVMLSGYEDFEYAKEAMAIGIRHYLLKPVMAEKLIATLSLIRDQQQTRGFVKHGERIKNAMFNENLPLIKSKLLNNLIHHRLDIQDVADQAKTLHISLEGPAYQIFVLEIDDYRFVTERLSAKNKEAHRFAILNVAEETMLSHFPGFVCYGEPAKLIGLGNVQTGVSMPAVCEEIRSNLSQYLKVSSSIGIGRPSDSIAAIACSYRDAVSAVRQKAYQGKGLVLPYGGHSAEGAFQGGAGLFVYTEEEKRLVRCLKSMDTEGLRAALRTYFDRFSTDMPRFEVIKGSCVRLILSLIRMMEEMDIELERVFPAGFLPHIEVEKYEVIADLEAWIRQIIGQIIDLIEQRDSRNIKRLVKEAVRFISSHYSKSIALSEVAEHVSVTPPHLSKVFKEEMGVTFVKWLNQFRMEEAKKLLKTSWLKTYEIAERVGYPDYKYFSILFKQYTGYSPRDYRNQ